MQFLFYGVNLFALVFWSLLIFIPRAQLAQRLSCTVWPFLILTTYYLVNLVYTLLMWQPIFSLEAFFALPSGLYSGWAHYLVVDLFIGQYIYRRTDNYNLGYALNQLLTLMAAPLGLLIFLYREKHLDNLSLDKSQD